MILSISHGMSDTISSTEGGRNWRQRSEDVAAPPGSFVRVPLASRVSIGVVWGPASGEVAPARLKSVLGRLDAPPLSACLRRFIDWLAAYTLSPPGAVLRMAMSVPEALSAPRPRIGYADGRAA